MSDSVIIYRSTMEKNIDEFWSSQEGLSIIGHGIEIVGVIIAVFLLSLVYDRIASRFRLPTTRDLFNRVFGKRRAF